MEIRIDGASMTAHLTIRPSIKRGLLIFSDPDAYVSSSSEESHSTKSSRERTWRICIASDKCF